MIPRPLWIGGTLIGASLLLAIFPQAFAPYDPVAFDYNALMQAPSWTHPMGTDNFGRDVLSRVIHAYRIDMQIAFFGTVLKIVDVSGGIVKVMPTATSTNPGKTAVQ